MIYKYNPTDTSSTLQPGTWWSDQNTCYHFSHQNKFFKKWTLILFQLPTYFYAFSLSVFLFSWTYFFSLPPFLEEYKMSFGYPISAQWQRLYFSSYFFKYITLSINPFFTLCIQSLSLFLLMFSAAKHAQDYSTPKNKTKQNSIDPFYPIAFQNLSFSFHYQGPWRIIESSFAYITFIS